MTQRQEIIERLNGLEMEGGSHAMLSAICKAVLPHSDAWTLRRCADLRDRLVRLLGEVDEEALREAYTKGREDGMGVANAKNAQAEYLRGKNDGYAAGYDAGFASADDWLSQHEDAMAEHGWYRALNADKQPIKLGDEVYQVKGGWVYTVESITFYPDNTTVSFSCKHGNGCDSAHNVRHYLAPTVEDVLYDSLKHFGAVEERTPEVDSWVCEQAAKLREMLASDAK